jgi:hypothetical protein
MPRRPFCMYRHGDGKHCPEVAEFRFNPNFGTGRPFLGVALCRDHVAFGLLAYYAEQREHGDMWISILVEPTIGAVNVSRR